MKWIKHEGYNETHQYVDEKGRILAEVRGSYFEKDRGWEASDETVEPSERLGRYVTVDDAKRAAETKFKEDSES